MLHRKNGKRLGMTVAEFGLVLPAVMVLLLGTMEMGNLFHSWLTVQKAAQEAVRIAATGEGADDGTRMIRIENKALERMEPLQGTKTVTVSSWPRGQASDTGSQGSAGSPCEIVEVRASCTYTPLISLMEPILPDDITLSSADRKLNEPWRPCDS